MTRVYKILRGPEWDSLQATGIFSGSADDSRDGFIHLSAAHQLGGTLAKHFKNESGLVLLALDAEALGAGLKWEISRGGDLFPHLYAPLSRASVIASTPLARDAGGVHILPGEIY